MAKLLSAQLPRTEAAALIDEHHSRSWRDLNDRVNRLANAFRNKGLKPGDVISIFAGNCVEYYEIMLACAHSGVLYVPVNWHFTAEELAYVISNSESKWLFADRQFFAVAEQAVARRETPMLHQCVGIGSTSGEFADYEALIANANNTEPDNQVLGGPMFYTSGTTGRPKGVRGSANAAAPPPVESMMMMGAGLSGLLSIPANGTTLLCGPVYHSAQWAFSFLPLINGSTVVMRHKFDPAQTLELIDQHQVTNIHLVPTQFHRLLRLDDSVRKNFSGKSLQVVWHGAAPCPPEVKKRMIQWWGAIVHEYYGSTEGSIVTLARAQEWLARPGTLGKPTPMVDLRIIRDDGSDAPTGEPGRIFVKNKMGTDFEYHKDPAKTAAAHLEKGVFTFGDVGYLDADGYLFMSDRAIDMIISGGVNIYPAEIEAVLVTHPAVVDAAVFGIPNDEFGEEVKAAIQLQSPHQASDSLAQELMNHCRTHLAGYKAPRSIDFVNDMPRHETGKLYKRLLRDKYWEGTGRKI